MLRQNFIVNGHEAVYSSIGVANVLRRMFVTNMLGVLKFLKDYIPCFRKYAHDCLIEKGAFEAPIPLSDIYYEE